MKSKNILEVTDFSVDEFTKLIKRSLYFKKHWGKKYSILQGKRIGLLFDAASLRTKLSFEIATHTLGGFPYFVDIDSITHEKGVPRGSYEDIIESLDKFVDAYVIRDYSQNLITVLKRKTFPPIVNGFSVTGHPSQAIADVTVIIEQKGDLTKLNICGVCPATGSGVIESFVYAVLLLGGNITLITPTGRFKGKNSDFLTTVEGLQGTLTITDNPKKVIPSADVLYVDEWWYPGSEFLTKKPSKKYQVDSTFLKHSKENLIVLHCLPAHHEREISEEVIRSDKSIVFEEAQFRIYSAMALLEYVALP